MQDLQPCAIMPLVASRLAFPEVAADWDLADHLHVDLREAYVDPATLRVADPPALPVGKVCGRMSEFTTFAQRADRAGGVELFGDDELERDEGCNVIVAGFFSLWKSQTRDRTITSRLAFNLLERQVGVSGHLLAHGVMLGEIQLREHEKARMSGKDLPNAYHHGRASVLRAKTYAVGKAVASSHFARGRAFERLIARRTAAGLVPVVPDKVRVSLPLLQLPARVVPMCDDSLAVGPCPQLWLVVGGVESPPYGWPGKNFSDDS